MFEKFTKKMEHLEHDILYYLLLDTYTLKSVPEYVPIMFHLFQKIGRSICSTFLG